MTELVGDECFINKSLCGFKETGTSLVGWMKLSGHSWHQANKGFYEQRVECFSNDSYI